MKTTLRTKGKGFKTGIDWDRLEKFIVNRGYCTKDNSECNVGGDPPKMHKHHRCNRGLAGWVLESSTGCPYWKPY